jgi:hypothetical protein
MDKPATITVTISGTVGICKPYCVGSTPVWGKVATYDGTFVLANYEGLLGVFKCGWQFFESAEPGEVATFPVVKYSDAGCATPGGSVTVRNSLAHVYVIFQSDSPRFAGVIHRGSTAFAGCPDGTNGSFDELLRFEVESDQEWDCCAPRVYDLEGGGTMTLEACS